MIHWRRAIIVSCLAYLSGCGPADPNKTAFKGTWRHVQENSIANTKEEEIVTVTADGERFRIQRTFPESQSIEVFDGKTLYFKTLGDPSMPPSESSRAATVTDTGSVRFWTGYQQGKSSPGGLIAGQETVMYEQSSHRSDGDIGSQEWIEPKTGILLKSSSSIYSSQARLMVRQEMWECQSINFGPIEESAFQKP